MLKCLAKAGEHDADRLAELVLNDLADEAAEQPKTFKVYP
jgi:hypothetical protein